MPVVSAPVNSIAQQKDLFRLAASLYSETNNMFSQFETQLQVIKCVFVSCGNREMKSEEVIVELLNLYKYHITEDEFFKIVDCAQNVFVVAKVDKNDAFRLTEDAYRQTVESQKHGIDFYIDKYIEEICAQNIKEYKDAIYQYLYELTTTNINSYRVLLHGREGVDFSDRELSINVDYLSDKQKQIVQDFLDWDNTEKNISLGNVVYCCLEYCLLVNGDAPNKLLQDVIREREIYLDTNMIFRALGINGVSYQKVVEAFLGKCLQAKIKIMVSSLSRKEFFDSIDYYCKKIGQFPRGNTYLYAYEQLSDYSIFPFYEGWRQEHPNLSLKNFKIYIRSLYKKFIVKYGIIDDCRLPYSVYNSSEFKEKQNLYALSIRKIKQELRPEIRAAFETTHTSNFTQRDNHDASMVCSIEFLRENAKEEKDIFLVSSDRALRNWDMKRSKNLYPIVVYPSQLFLILIKLCGRSADDYSSFVSFISIRAKSTQVTPETANVIISGISSITEDLESQKILVSAIYDEEFQHILQRSKTDDELFKQTQQFSKNYLKKQLKERDKKIAAISEAAKKNSQQIEQMREEAERMKAESDQLKAEAVEKGRKLTTLQENSRKHLQSYNTQKEQVYEFAKKHIMPLFCLQYYIIPVFLMILVFAFVSFIVLQFIFCDKEWNFAILFFNWMRGTTFGKEVGDFIHVIDGAFFAALVFLLKVGMKNPFNTNAKKQAKSNMIERYIKRNNLE